MTQFLVEDGIDFFFFRATDELPEFTNTSVVVALELVCLLCFFFFLLLFVVVVLFTFMVVS